MCHVSEATGHDFGVYLKNGSVLASANNEPSTAKQKFRLDMMKLGKLFHYFEVP